MVFKNVVSRLRKRDDAGLTLIEMVVGMFIMGLVSILIFNVFQSTNETAKVVQSGTTSIASSQTTTSELAKEIRNAKVIKVATNGNRLDIERTDGTCIAWVYNSSALYMKKSATAAAFVNTWIKRIDGATLNSGQKFFAPLTKGAKYTFNLGDGVGSVSLTGDAFMRLAAERNTSVCFGDAPVTPGTPTPTPTPTPAPVVTYSISYSLDGGSVLGNPSSYASSTANITLINPTRSGYTFSGWTGTGVSGSSNTVTIPTGSTGDRAYVATWTIIPVTPTPTPTPASSTTATYARGDNWSTGYSVNLTVNSPEGGKGQALNWTVSWTDSNATNGTVSGSGMTCTISSGLITCKGAGYGSENFKWNKSITVSAQMPSKNGTAAPTNPTLTVQ